MKNLVPNILTQNCYNIPEIVETVHPTSDHFPSSVHLNPRAYLLHWCQAFSVHIIQICSSNRNKIGLKTSYLKLVRVHGMQTGKYRRTNSTLQKMNRHQHQRVTRNGHILGVVNIMKLSPQLNDQR